MRRLVVVLSALLLVLVSAGAGWAHVEVAPESATAGSIAKLAFSVPNERDDAATTKVELFLPADHPLATVDVEPVPGWTAAEEKTHLTTPIKTDDGDTVTDAVTHITWSGGQIKAGEFQEFVISAGPLPSVGQLAFKALQTYSDGQVVRWIEEAAPGTSEPEHPAPVLKITPEGASGSAAAPVSVETKKASTSGAVALAVVSLVLAVVALLVGLVASRRPSAGSASSSEQGRPRIGS
jgi:uncharacterized protein YcnI